MTDVSDVVNDNIRERLKAAKRGVQRRFAKALKVKEPHISGVMTQGDRLHPKHWAAAAEFFGVTVDDLMRLDGHSPIESGRSDLPRPGGHGRNSPTRKGGGYAGPSENRVKELEFALALRQSILESVQQLAVHVGSVIEAAINGKEAEASALLGRLLRVVSRQTDRRPTRKPARKVKS